MTPEQQAIAEFALTSEENLRLTFLTHQSYSHLCKNLAIKFHNELRERVMEVYTSDDWILPGNTPERLIEFMIGNKKWPGNVKFGCLDFNDIDRLCFYVKAEPSFRTSIFAAVDTAIKGRITGAGWWLRFTNPYNRWEASWEGIKSLYSSKDLINYTLENFRSISNALESHFRTVIPNNYI